MRFAVAGFGTSALLWTIFALYVGFHVLRFVVVLHAMLKERMRHEPERTVRESEVPPHLRAGFAVPAAELEALGFTPLGWTISERTVPITDTPLHTLWLRNDEHASFAFVRFTILANPADLYRITFHTYGADGRSLVTVNGSRHFMPLEPSAILWQDPYAATLSGQWDAHVSGLRAHGIVGESLDLDALAARDNAIDSGFGEAERRGLAVACADGSFALTWRGALLATRKALAGMKRAAKLNTERNAARARSGVALPAVPIEEEIATVERIEAARRAPARRSLYVLVLLATVVLFGLSMFAWGDALVAAMLFGVVALHELGHYTAMRALGYQDTTIFFIPFLGGATVGRKHDATLSEQIIVLLGGPVPGLVLAAVLSLAIQSPPAWLTTGLWLLVAINVFNLLPVLPLDGGRIVHLLLFARNRWLDTAARVAAGLCLGALGLALGDTMLLVLCAFTLIGVPQGFRLAALRGSFERARAACPPTSPREETSLFLQVLRETGRGALPAARKALLARSVLFERTVNARPGLATTAAWLGMYGVCVIGGLVAVVLVTITGAAASDSRTSPRTAAVGVPLAPIACEAAAQLASANATAPIPTAEEAPGDLAAATVVAVAAFERPEAAVAGAKRVTEVVPSATTRIVATVLFVGVPETVGAFTDDDREPTPAEVAAWETRAVAFGATAERTRAAVRAAGGELRAGPFASPTVGGTGLRCDAQTESAARALDDELSDYSAAQGIALRPPWVAPLHRSAADADRERTARSTYRFVQEAKHEAMRRRFRPGILRALWEQFVAPARSSEEMRSADAEIERAVRSAIAARRRLAPVDDEVVRLALTRGGEKWRQLADQMGAADLGDHTSGFGAVTSVVRTGRRLEVQLSLYTLPAVDHTFVPAVAWLCSRGCGNPTLVVRATDDEQD